ncbi:MAG: hypothetical protein J1E42_02110 [Akkermansiaceae bacterium]|nr:hypothetical protein [Akkermansiaceae bacterium]
MTPKKLTFVLLLFVLGLCSRAFAQLEVRIDTPRREYVAGEQVNLVVTITNHTDSSISLTSTPGRSWMYVQVARYGDPTPMTPVTRPRYNDLVINPGARRSITIALKPYFQLDREGSYRASVTLRLPDMQTTYTSNNAPFSLSNGGVLRNYTVQVRGQRLNTSVRLLSVKGKTYLFGQVSNADTKIPVGACCFGPYLNFMEPRVLLDNKQNLHLLCQNSPQFYTYAIMDTFGALRKVEVMQRTGGLCDLVSTGGGIRCVGLVPYKAPKKATDRLHSASERP